LRFVGEAVDGIFESLQGLEHASNAIAPIKLVYLTTTAPKSLTLAVRKS